ncbi:hypothetical protein [Streptomyces sp. NPDC052693]|uniref:MmyB family transcriptional regulator n=1 Tax=Streptomyces sp. NPDC052693 TaxID=3155814 RepID=UPI0034252671
MVCNDSKLHTHGRRTFHHPEVGGLTLGYQSMELEGTPGHQLITYDAAPGTTGYDALVLLGSQPASHASTSSRGETASSAS